MKTIFFISDTHFCHQNIIEYCNRPFATTDDMNEAMIENWNTVVKPQDHVWHLGDVGMGFKNEAEFAAVLRRLNGHKRLTVGNHDKIKTPILHQYFEKIELWRNWKDEGFTSSHIPLNVDQLPYGIQIHGHIHTNLKDGPYINVCVEHTAYAPIPMEDIVEQVRSIQYRSKWVEPR